MSFGLVGMASLQSKPTAATSLFFGSTVMLGFTSLFVFFRAALYISRHKTFELPDFFIFLAFIFYLSLWICYAMAILPMIRAYPVLIGEKTIDREMMEDAATVLQLFMGGQMCFFALLFSVKISLLTLFRKWLVDLPKIYTKIWWGVLTFCLVVGAHCIEHESFTKHVAGMDL